MTPSLHGWIIKKAMKVTTPGPSDPQEHQKPPGKVQCDVNLINCKLVWEFAQPKYTVRPLFEYLATLTVLLKGPCVEIKF